MSRPRAIAFYLPQYYPFKENDEWWGKGFTEWTNVGRARPLFKGHYQPRVPADLGYYDLRVTEVREKQAQLAKDAGIEGFCYWHYWFSGKRLMDRVFSEVVESGTPNFPFCLCWANHSWYAKTWDPNLPDKLLIEQMYPGIDDYINHFNALLPAFKDPRYMKADGKLIFGLFSPLDDKSVKLFIDTWNRLAQENGLNGFYFFGFTFFPEQKDDILKSGFDSVVIDWVKHVYSYKKLTISTFVNKLKKKLLNRPFVLLYDEYVAWVKKEMSLQDNIHPSIDPNFDHSPRSAYRGVIFHNSTPKKWASLCEYVSKQLSSRNGDSNLLFIKAWNEWGEGNYLEPDLKFGDQYLQMTKEALK